MSDMETREVKLGDIVKHNKGYAFKSSEYTDEGVMVVRVTDFTLDSISDADAVYLAPDDRYDKFVLKTNDILIQTVGSWANNPNSIVGKVVRVPKQCDNAYLNQNIVRIIPNNDLDNTYLFYALKANHFSTYCVLRGQGAANQASITLDTIFRFKFKAHNFTAQKRIAGILSTYDSLIENNKKRIRLLEQMAENLYKEWFVRFRFPGYEDVEFENGFPKDWEKVKLDDVLNKIATGLNPRKNFVLGEGENFYVTIKNMADNTVYLDNKCDKVNDDAIIKINKRSDLKIGDLLFSGIGTIGRVCLIDIPTNNWNISESVFTMRANKKISSEFLFMLLLSQDVQNYCQSKANGSAQKGIRMGDLRKYTFLLPTKNVINDFTNQISPILRNVSLLRNENNNLIQQRDLLLPRLMSGKLEV